MRGKGWSQATNKREKVEPRRPIRGKGWGRKTNKRKGVEPGECWRRDGLLPIRHKNLI